MKKTLLLIFVMLTHSYFSSGVNRGEAGGGGDCRKVLLDYIKEMGEIDVPKDKKVYYMDMTVTSLMRDNKVKSLRGEILLSKSQRQYISSQFSTFQDAEDAFTIMHPSKTIIWTKGMKLTDSKERKQRVMDMQLALVSSSTVTKCEDGNGKRQVVLVPDKEIATSYKVSYLTYTINTQTQKVEKVVVEFDKTSELLREEVVYHKIDFNYASKLNSPVRNKIVDERDQLLKKYKGYQLIDNR